MLTRCPVCATRFRITPEQLKARQGKVRCGECQHVFNALESLADAPPVIVAAAPASPSSPVPVNPISQPVDPAGFPEISDPAEPALEAAPAGTDAEAAVWSAPTFAETEPTVDRQAVPDAEEMDQRREPILGEGVAEIAEPVLAEPTVALLPSVQSDGPSPALPLPELPLNDTWAPPPAPRRWPWVLGLLVAMLGLALQLVLHYRIEVSVLAPEARPFLAGVCEIAGCTVGLPSKAELLTIEASDLQPETDRKGLLMLTATLRNRAPFAQEYPHLELTLTDANNSAIARRVLAPADYLSRGTVGEKGMAIGELALAMTIDAGDAGASGYRLYLFYP